MTLQARGASQPTLRDLAQVAVATGRIEAIVLRPARRSAAVLVDAVLAVAGRGLEGDHRAARSAVTEAAQASAVTLVQAEHLPLIAQWVGLPQVRPEQLRRNLVVSGINLLAMRSPFAGQALQWIIGDEVLIEVSGPCAPCSRMEHTLGTGGYNAMRGHGGLRARIVRGGLVARGDAVRLCTAADQVPQNVR